MVIVAACLPLQLQIYDPVGDLQLPFEFGEFEIASPRVPK